MASAQIQRNPAHKRALKSTIGRSVLASAGGYAGGITPLAKERGAVVFTTVGNAEKADIARRRGADHCLLYRETDFSQVLRELTGGRGVDVVYDSVGRTTFERSLRCVRRRGLCVLFGVGSGTVRSVSPFELAEGGLAFLHPAIPGRLPAQY
jgi:NADPH:quinone reductase